jgi:hypothetical protein
VGSGAAWQKVESVKFLRCMVVFLYYYGGEDVMVMLEKHE